jgi:hypothetical protein
MCNFANTAVFDDSHTYSNFAFSKIISVLALYLISQSMC